MKNNWRVFLLLVLIPGIFASCNREAEINNLSKDSTSQNNLFSFRDKFYGVTSHGAQDVWVVGHLGKIFYSNDGGLSWKKQPTNSEEPIYDICFANDSKGWAAGDLGLILSTSDGGKTWERQGSGTDKTLFGIDFVDEAIGWAVGYYGTILHTTDGGKTWQKQSLNEDVGLNGVDFLDQRTGWVVGEFASIFHTSDGGKSWGRQHGAPVDESFREKWEEEKGLGDKTLFGVAFQDSLEGWVAGMDGVIAHTTDGGITWKAQKTGTTKNLYDIKVEQDFGIAVGALGTIVVTDGPGEKWIPLLSTTTLKTYDWLTAVEITGDKQAFITGGHGTLLEMRGAEITKNPGKPRFDG